MNSTVSYNPEQPQKQTMTRSFLKKRGTTNLHNILDDLRQSGHGSTFFNDNKIRSCSYVKQTKSGCLAVPFYDKRNNTIYPTISAQKRSWSSSVHSNAKHEHAGIGMNKTLAVYDTIKSRNLLLIPDYRPPYRNCSQIQIGNRSVRDTKHYLSTYRNDMIYLGKLPQINHPGIQAFKNKWLRSRLQL